MFVLERQRPLLLDTCHLSQSNKAALINRHDSIESFSTLLLLQAFTACLLLLPLPLLSLVFVFRDEGDEYPRSLFRALGIARQRGKAIKNTNWNWGGGESASWNDSSSTADYTNLYIMQNLSQECCHLSSNEQIQSLSPRKSKSPLRSLIRVVWIT